MGFLGWVFFGGFFICNPALAGERRNRCSTAPRSMFPRLRYSSCWQAAPTACKQEGEASVVDSEPVLRIHDILGWIRILIWIRGSMPLTNGSGSGSCYFRHRPSRCQQKTIFLFYFFCLLLFEGTFTFFFKVKKCHKIVGIKVFLDIFA